MAPRMLPARRRQPGFTPGGPAATDPGGAEPGGEDDSAGGVQRTRPGRRRPPAWALGAAITSLLGVAYLTISPPAADLTAATYRSDVFGRAGLALWDNGWYGGHHLPGYSLLSPALGHLLGPRVLLVISAVAAAGLFGSLSRSAFGEAAGRVASAWFAVGLSVGLLSGRVPYYLGLAIGLGALVAFARGLTAVALALAAVTSLASPVAGAFLALAGLACAVGSSPTGSASSILCDGPVDGTRPGVGGTGPGGVVAARTPGGRGSATRAAPARTVSARTASTRSSSSSAAARSRSLGLGAAALAPILALAVAFPEGGYEPFAPAAFWPALGLVALTGAVLGSRHRALGVGIALYALALAGSFFLHTPVGGNAARLGPLVAGPLVGAALWSARAARGRSSSASTRTASTGSSLRRLLLAALAPALLYWQLVTPVRDLSLVAGDRSVHASYFAPLLAELARLSSGHPVGGGPDGVDPVGVVRIEVPLTGTHAEADQLAGHDHVLLARGWERQLDTRYDAIFYRRTLPPAAYRAWLLDNAVAYVAVPDVRLDGAARREGELIARGVPFLAEVWRSAHWRLYAVRGARPLVDPPATVAAVGVDQVTLRSPRPATVTLRVRYSPYWALGAARGCVARAPGGWTSLRLSAPGTVRLRIAFSVARIFDRSARCSS
jgi:hypothetical protein